MSLIPGRGRRLRPLPGIDAASPWPCDRRGAAGPRAERRLGVRGGRTPPRFPKSAPSRMRRAPTTASIMSWPWRGRSRSSGYSSAGRRAVCPQRRSNGEIVTGMALRATRRVAVSGARHARDMLDFSRYTRLIARRAGNEPGGVTRLSRGLQLLPAKSVGRRRATVPSRPRGSLAEVDDIFTGTGIRNILFLDDSLTARKVSEMHLLCDGLAERGVKWRGVDTGQPLRAGR